jgi:hypothetical protein
MKKLILTINIMPLFIGMLLLSSQLFVAFGTDADDLNAIRTANASRPGSASPHYRWVFESVSGPFRLYLFARNTANNDILHVRVNNVDATVLPNNPRSNDAPSTTAYTVNANVGDRVDIFMTSGINTFNAWDWDANGYCHVKVVGFPGYDNPTYQFPPGLWLGWEDDPNNFGAFDYTDFCVILTGCKARFMVRDPRDPNNVWNTYTQNPNNYIIPNRIISWTEESPF